MEAPNFFVFHLSGIEGRFAQCCDEFDTGLEGRHERTERAKEGRTEGGEDVKEGRMSRKVVCVCVHLHACKYIYHIHTCMYMHMYMTRTALGGGSCCVRVASCCA